MLTPTTAELHTAIEVLRKLNLRINENAARSVRQVPYSSQAGRLVVKLGRMRWNKRNAPMR